MIKINFKINKIVYLCFLGIDDEKINLKLKKNV